MSRRDPTTDMRVLTRMWRSWNAPTTMTFMPPAPELGTVSPGTSPRRFGLALFAIVLIFGAIVWPFRYHRITAEPDLDHVAFTVLQGHRSGLGLNGGYPYGPSLSFGYYAAVERLLPDAVLSDPDRLIDALNGIGYASSLLVLLFLGVFLSRLYGGTAALGAVVLTGFSPVYLELACAGHPILPSTALLLLGGIAMLEAERRSASVALLARIGAIVALVAAWTVRGEVALAYPLLAFAPFPAGASRGPSRWMLRGAVLLVPMVVFVLLQRALVHGGGSGALVAYMKEFHRFGAVARGFLLFALAFGVVSAIAILAALAWAVRRAATAGRALAGPFLTLAGGMAFWLPNPTPTRHFLYPILGGAILAATWLGRRSPRAAMVLAVTIVVANQIVAEALYPVVASRYPWNYPAATVRRATSAVPLGFWVLSHRAVEAQRIDQRAEARLLRDVRDSSIIVLADANLRMMLEICGGPEPCSVHETRLAGFPAVSVRRGGQEFLFVRKNEEWPTDVLGRILASNPLPGARYYVQPSTRSHYDRAEPPAEKTLQLSGGS